ncbi:MAG: transcriptional regulator, partial [Alphaproteobacteria bacterium]|nr:transcriptional regulator [Alphaproteobacteria bacterium]
TNRISAGRLLEIARLLEVPLLRFYPDEASASKAPADVDCDIDAVSAFMASAEGWRLCRTFLKIGDVLVRKKLLALVEDLAAS